MTHIIIIIMTMTMTMTMTEAAHRRRRYDIHGVRQGSVRNRRQRRSRHRWAATFDINVRRRGGCVECRRVKRPRVRSLSHRCGRTRNRDGSGGEGRGRKRCIGWMGIDVGNLNRIQSQESVIMTTNDVAVSTIAVRGHIRRQSVGMAIIGKVNERAVTKGGDRFGGAREGKGTHRPVLASCRTPSKVSHHVRMTHPSMSIRDTGR
mmetsp:Transcript_27004/g.49721  ORF Transcript_27004/g.49721 Transcript_27004/m.49721 type:complete len:205 (-) Transcript_27004:80-694(-)